jgi:hypothetical protein
VRFRDRKNPEAFRKELRELLHKEYITACSKCTGSNDKTLPPGVQIDKDTILLEKNDSQSSLALEK